MEDVIDALELAGPLQRQDVEGLLDDAQAGRVTTRVATDRAERRIADVEAAVAEDDLVADVDEGRGERAGLGIRGAEQVVRQALGGLGADPGQAREGIDEPRDRFDERGGHARTTTGPGSSGRR